MSTKTVVWPLLLTWSVSRKRPTPLSIEAELSGFRYANYAPDVEKKFHGRWMIASLLSQFGICKADMPPKGSAMTKV
jgi:hypothetical protein